MTKIEVCRKITGLNKPHQRTIIYSIVDEDDDGPRYGTSIKCVETGTEAVARRLTDDRERIESAADFLASYGISPAAMEKVVYDILKVQQ